MGAILVHLNGRGGSTNRDLFSGGGGMVISRAALVLWRAGISGHSPRAPPIPVAPRARTERHQRWHPTE
eukprot:gene21072-66014_t